MPSDDSWDEYRPHPCAMCAFRASARGICAGRTPGAASQPTFNPWVQGSSPCRSNCETPLTTRPPWSQSWNQSGRRAWPPVRQQAPRPGEFGALGGQLVGGPGRPLRVGRGHQQPFPLQPLEGDFGQRLGKRGRAVLLFSHERILARALTAGRWLVVVCKLLATGDMAAMTILDEIQTSIRQHAEGAGSSVVGIGQRWGVGSGIVLAEGRVLTNAHNVRGDQVTVTFADGRTAEGSVAGQDIDGDLAVIEVDTGGAPPLAWADGAAAAIGTPVFALSKIGRAHV